MGLLDDAIREHMELKRLRGADPSEVARQERDVLGSVVQDRDGVNEERPDDEDGAEELAPERQVSGGEVSGGELSGGEDDGADTQSPARGADFANVGQETAELDMRTVLDEQHEAVDHAGQIDSVDAFHAHGESPETVEDVLEETPEFLRDTPEQERLWFEQRPPRDFDFDK